jgi:membrane-bound lytic murein transglycosylase B
VKKIKHSTLHRVALTAACFGLGLTASISTAADKPARYKTVSSNDSAPDSVTYGRRDDVMAFAAEAAARHGLDITKTEATLARARFIPSVARFIMPPPAGTAKNWAAYRDRFIEPKRVNAGAAFWRANKGWLNLAEERFGVPAEIKWAPSACSTHWPP